jgi:hypothetical protein
VFECFRDVFQADEREDLSVVQAITRSGDLEVDQLLKQFGGQSFNQGLYRVICPGAIAHWAERASMAFPCFVGAVTQFGLIGWAGCSLWTLRVVWTECPVVMLDRGRDKPWNSRVASLRFTTPSSANTGRRHWPKVSTKNGVQRAVLCLASINVSGTSDLFSSVAQTRQTISNS